MVHLKHPTNAFTPPDLDFASFLPNLHCIFSGYRKLAEHTEIRGHQMKRVLYFAPIAMLMASAAFAETLNNDSVLALLDAGLGDEVVIAKIKSSPSSFDLSTDTIIALKQRGVSGPVLAAMISASAVPASTAMSIDSPDPLVPHPSGIYLGGIEKMTRIESTTTRQARTSGMLGAALTGGLSGMRIKAAINGPTANVRTNENRPVFYFYFDQAEQGLGAAGGAITSPQEFSLISFEPKKDKREAVVGSVGLGGTKAGLRDKDQRDFEVTQIKPGVYKVIPTETLIPGEYGFISGGVGAGANATFRVFDFGVTK
ncbi:MAG: hypothetical protein IPG54_11470 [Sphingomonadales bacterium]|jgi:hypothetical protein|nr:hypothetical protein [Sphingomonadales bacterium]MBK9004315.1 hypothetical protein [Sphingomonadales bacterium]MBK9269491.1 hypothetical protein [Sphingomonadales bacterium]MBP6435592.1 hypothetical protein [Sphingorhabdus sp.]